MAGFRESEGLSANTTGAIQNLEGPILKMHFQELIKHLPLTVDSSVPVLKYQVVIGGK